MTNKAARPLNAIDDERQMVLDWERQQFFDGHTEADAE